MRVFSVFIDRPIATSLLTLGLVLLGLLGLSVIPIAPLPQIDYPTLQVLTLYPGANSRDMASLVTAPLEQNLRKISGLTHITSESAYSVSVITLEFALDAKNYEQDVQSAITTSTQLLPSDLPTSPTYIKINPADSPVYTFALTSDTLSISGIRRIAETRLIQKLSQIKGVGLVQILGGQRPATVISFNPLKLASYGMSSEQLRSIILQLNINLPKGSLDGALKSYVLNVNDQITNLETLKNSVIAFKNGQVIFLKDVADVFEGAENAFLHASYNRHGSLIIEVHRQPQSNIIETVQSIKSLLPGIMKSFPASVDLYPITDRTLMIKSTMHHVYMELGVAVVFVVLMIFLFFKNWRATLVPSLAVPISLIGAVGCIEMIGFSLNSLTLMGMTIATGFVVDDAIVVFENIVRYLEKGYSSVEAAKQGVSEIGFTIVSLTLSLIAVFIPLLFMGNLIGRIFYEFAVTMVITIGLSAVLSLTFIPMLCALLVTRLHGADTADHDELNKEGWYASLLRGYSKSLQLALRHQYIVLLGFLLTVVLTVVEMVGIQKNFFPLQDTSLIEGTFFGDQRISYAKLFSLAQSVEAALLGSPDVEKLTSYIGVDSQNKALNSGKVSIVLKPLDQRQHSIVRVMHDLKQRVERASPVRIFLRANQDLTTETTPPLMQYQVLVQSLDFGQLTHWVPKIVDVLKTSEIFSDVSTDLQPYGLGLELIVDQVSARRYGITPKMIGDTLYNAFAGRMISTIYTESNQYRVVLKANANFFKTAQDLLSLYVVSDTNASIPLSSFATLKDVHVPMSLASRDQFPIARVAFNLKTSYALSDVMPEIERLVGSIDLPNTVSILPHGSLDAYKSSQWHQFWLVVAAIIVIYIILGVLYESLIHPITILSTLPSAACGGMLCLWFFGYALDLLGVIGLILLIGIVKKNAIMMIDFALKLRKQGYSSEESIYRASLLRFRPIIMTTCVAVVAAIPMIYGHSSGFELRKPLGLVIVGGLICCQLLTLYSTPVLFLTFERIQERLSLFFQHWTKHKS